MFRKTMIALTGSAAIAIAGSALAQGQGGGHGGGHGNAGQAPANAGQPENAGPAAGSMGDTMRDQARTNSQGPANASDTAITNANENSVLSTDTDTDQGTVIRAGPNAGQRIGGRKARDKDEDEVNANVSTQSRALERSQGPSNASPTGIANANENSVLARGAVATTMLPGLTTGLQVQTSAGTSIGTVSQIITGPNDTIRAVVVRTTSGETLTLVANTLTISGGVVTTTQANVGS